jgi:hypothetical protein
VIHEYFVIIKKEVPKLEQEILDFVKNIQDKT